MLKSSMKVAVAVAVSKNVVKKLLFIFINSVLYLSYDPYGPARAFSKKPLMKVPYEGPAYAFARAEPEKAVRPYYKSVRPRVLKLQENLSPNWSYDKILILIS